MFGIFSWCNSTLMKKILFSSRYRQDSMFTYGFPALGKCSEETVFWNGSLSFTFNSIKYESYIFADLVLSCFSDENNRFLSSIYMHSSVAAYFLCTESYSYEVLRTEVVWKLFSEKTIKPVQWLFWKLHCPILIAQQLHVLWYLTILVLYSYHPTFLQEKPNGPGFGLQAALK